MQLYIFQKIIKMKQKFSIIFLLILLLGVIIFMVYDFYYNSDNNPKNIYEYKIDKFKKQNTDLIAYSEIKQIKPEIKKLRGIATDNENKIYVTGKNKIIIFDKNGNLLKTIKTGKDAFCINISPKNEIYLGLKNHIEVWDTSGNMVKTEKKIHEKTIITSVLVNNKYFYVADAGTKFVYQYDLKGKLINKIGEKDTIKNTSNFIIPSPYFDLAKGRDNEIWVVNSGKHSLEAYNENGKLISSWSKSSMKNDGFCGCCNPSHIALLSGGEFVTSEKGIERVKIHLPSGEFKCLVAASNKFEKGTKGLDLAVDTEDRILVLDPKKKLIRIFTENKSKL